jgi:hypothetical protein
LGWRKAEKGNATQSSGNVSSATSSNKFHGAQFIGVRDSRNRRVPEFTMLRNSAEFGAESCAHSSAASSMSETAVKSTAAHEKRI